MKKGVWKSEDFFTRSFFMLSFFMLSYVAKKIWNAPADAAPGSNQAKSLFFEDFFEKSYPFSRIAPANHFFFADFFKMVIPTPGF